MRAWWGINPPPRDWNDLWRGPYRRPYGDWYYVNRTVTTRPAVDERRIREIVREEIAELPIPFDVPDTPPEA